MEARRAETEATIHTIRCQFESFLTNIELSKLYRVSLTLDLVLDELTLLDECLEHKRQNSVFCLGPCLFGELDFFAAHHRKVLIICTVYWKKACALAVSAVVILTVTSVDCCEAQSVLLDDTWVQTVEIEQQNDAVVESSFRIKDEATSILCFLSFWSLFAFLSFFLSCSA